MAHDPLSPSTRKARTGLLVFSIAALSFDVFATKIDNIDLPDVGIVFDSSLIPFVLSVSLVYFFISFIWTALDDISNMPTPERKVRLEDEAERRCRLIKSRALEEVFDQTIPFREPKAAKLLIRNDAESDIVSLIELETTMNESDYFEGELRKFKSFKEFKDGELYADVAEIIVRTRAELAFVTRVKSTTNRSIVEWFFDGRIIVLEFLFPIILSVFAMLVYFFDVPADWLRTLAG